MNAPERGGRGAPPAQPDTESQPDAESPPDTESPPESRVGSGPEQDGEDGARRGPRRPWRPSGRQVLQSVAGLALAVAVLVWVLPHFAGTTWHEVGHVLRTVGARPSLSHTFAAYALGRLLTTVGVTPGGIGVTETGTAAVLVGWAVAPASATAGVVLFSLYTHVMEIPLGALGWVAWGTSLRRARRQAPDR